MSPPLKLDISPVDIFSFEMFILITQKFNFSLECSIVITFQTSRCLLQMEYWDNCTYEFPFSYVQVVFGLAKECPILRWDLKSSWLALWMDLLEYHSKPLILQWYCFPSYYFWDPYWPMHLWLSELWPQALLRLSNWWLLLLCSSEQRERSSKS